MRELGHSLGIGLPGTAAGRELQSQVHAIPFWCHSIDLGLDVVTPGVKTPEVHARELASLQLPALRGKSVLDIGAWDGFYSFAAERLGADRVVALDHFVWALDWEAKNRYKADCRRRGLPRFHSTACPSCGASMRCLASGGSTSHTVRSTAASNRSWRTS